MFGVDRVEVGWMVIAEVHVDDDPVELAQAWHAVTVERDPDITAAKAISPSPNVGRRRPRPDPYRRYGVRFLSAAVDRDRRMAVLGVLSGQERVGHVKPLPGRRGAKRYVGARENRCPHQQSCGEM